MQSKAKDICDKFEDTEKMKSINDIVFSELKLKMEQAPNLIIELAPLGKFYYRKFKVQNIYNHPDVYPETKEICSRILDMYEKYNYDKLQVKYERFGKENHEAFILAKKQGKIQKFQKFEPEQYSELSGSGGSILESDSEG